MINVILAGRDPASGELHGVHVDLARELARRTGVPLELVGYPAAGAIVEALNSGALDVGLLSYEPARNSEVAISPVYLEVDATYLVPPGHRCAPPLMLIGMALVFPPARERE